MKYNPSGLQNYVGEFSALMFNMLIYRKFDREKDMIDKSVIKIFDAYEDTPWNITPEVVGATVQCYYDTKDTSYLLEAAILLLILNFYHKEGIYKQ